MSTLRTLSLLSFAVSALSLSACKKPEYPACKKDKHCKVDEGEKCVEGICQDCTTDEDCKAKGPNGEDWTCHELRCSDPNEVGGASGNGEAGAPCAQVTDCLGGLTCKAGVCSNCSDNADCANGQCNLETGRCAPEGQCQTDDECAMDEICDAGMCIFSGDVGDTSEAPCGLGAIYFPFDSQKITPKAQASLEGVVQCLKDSNRTVILEAHADNVGTEEYNIMLTDRRATSVAAFLTNLGVAATSVEKVPKGSLEATGSDEPSRAKDRRVQFIWK